ncbi:MAG: biotin/lipoyl-binding protein, partial [Candidatus Woesearchaeota archaeon]|nr:biotin/lipoyl-binding protein [Candidatus Woesearchaeota archaeon]
MKKFIVFIILIGLATGGYFYRDSISSFYKDTIKKYSNEKILRVAAKIAREFPPKEVEIFEIGRSQANLSFTKSGTAESATSAYVVPQTSGKITNINVKIGDRVKKGQTLVTIGDSLGTNISDIQYNTAVDGLNLAKDSKYLTQTSGEQTLSTVKTGIETAKKAYENAIQARDNAETLMDDSKDSAEAGKETAEKAYKTAKNNYNDAQDALSAIQDQYEALKSIPETPTDTLKEIEKGIAQAEAQVATLKYAKDSADSAIEQLDLSLNTLDDTKTSQMDQLDFAVEMARVQYRSAIDGLGSALTGTQLQELGVDAQILQAA